MALNFAPNDRGAGNTASDCFEAGYESNDRDLKKHPPRLAGKMIKYETDNFSIY